VEFDKKNGEAKRSIVEAPCRRRSFRSWPWSGGPIDCMAYYTPMSYLPTYSTIPNRSINSTVSFAVNHSLCFTCGR
jgi:hypothetical protein